MQLESNLSTPPERITKYLQKYLKQDGPQLRRRAVLSNAQSDEWQLVCCTVEAFPGSGTRPDPVKSRIYPNVILREDWLTAEACHQFVQEIQRNEIKFGTIPIHRDVAAQWGVQQLPLKNIYMPRAGVCAETNVRPRSSLQSHGPLLAATEPYYPDLAEATRHWLPFPSPFGSSDARNHNIFFLLPEARAFFGGARASGGAWEVTIDGTEVEQTKLKVKGAHWANDSLSHFESDVIGAKAVLKLPADIDRVEFVLMDAKGVVYDFQREDRFNHSGLGMLRFRSTHDLRQQVRAACLSGEGTRIELKPFIDCEQGIGKKDRKTKFRELVTSVVAFANTQGGRIFIGIDDDCSISGIAEHLQKWAKSKPDGSSADRYCRALTTKIKDHLSGDVSLQVSHVSIDGALVVVVRVDPVDATPITIVQDLSFYVRSGASNKSLPPHEWQGFVEGKIAIPGWQA